MKNFILVFAGFLAISSISVSARDLSYRLGAGYSQMSYSVRNDGATTSSLTQGSGINMSYGLAQDFQAGVFFGFADSFDSTAVGPYFRYDIQRLVNTDTLIWNHLNLFIQAAFLMKFGNAIKEGATIQAPTIGFEILPFERNNFAIGSQAGLIIDFVDKNKMNFTRGQLGDVFVKYYF